MFVQTVTEVNRMESEARLIADCRAGDPEAFRQIYERYERAVFRHALYLLGHREDADDVKQETFLRAYRTIGSFRSGCALQTWLFKICSNLCYDLLRRRQRRPQIAFEPDTMTPYLMAEAEGNDPVRINERAQTIQNLLQILQAMPMPQRHIITLYLLEGFDYMQIAEILGCARGSAKMRVLRAVEQYRERVASFLNEKV